MKGLASFPKPSQLQDAYEKLQGNGLISESKLILFSQWARLDPRLAEILVPQIAAHWGEISPQRLNEALNEAPWPSALGVVLEFAEDLSGAKKKFKIWKTLVMFGVKKAKNELFFVGQRKIAGKLMFDDVLLSARPYLKWGYWGRENLISKSKSGSRSLLGKATRALALKKFIRGRGSFTIEDYLKFLNFSISRRMAQLDLENNPKIIKYGHTRGRIYRARS